MAYDAARQRLVLFGGAAGSSLLGDTWEWNASAEGRPAIQLDASLRSAGVTAASVAGVRVRAFAGGSSNAGAGATLLGWAARGPEGSAGRWVPLGATNHGTPAALADRSTSILSWEATSAPEAARFLVERDLSMSFQIRPNGGAGSAPDGATVALDYIEVRVRYTPF
jgi:hypothetical protein